MRRMWLVAVLLVVAGVVHGAVFERFLSPDRPADRAIMNYYALANSGRATSGDLTELAVLLLEKGFPKDAEEYLKQALKLDTHNVEAAYRLGLVEQRMGNDRKAVRAYRRVVKQRPGYAPALFMLALAEERCGDRSAAIRDYAKAYHHAPELADPGFNPLVYDSKLQTEAQLVRYRREVASLTLGVTPVDQAAVKRMMLTKPPIPPVNVESHDGPGFAKEPQPPPSAKP